MTRVESHGVTLGKFSSAPKTFLPLPKSLVVLVDPGSHDPAGLSVAVFNCRICNPLPACVVYGNTLSSLYATPSSSPLLLPLQIAVIGLHHVLLVRMLIGLDDGFGVVSGRFEILTSRPWPRSLPCPLPRPHILSIESCFDLGASDIRCFETSNTLTLGLSKTPPSAFCLILEGAAVFSIVSSIIIPPSNNYRPSCWLVVARLKHPPLGPSDYVTEGQGGVKEDESPRAALLGSTTQSL